MKDEMTEGKLTDLLSKNFPQERSCLLPALHLIHKELGFLEEWSLEIAAKYLRVPVSEVWGCATSYTELKLEKPADGAVSICTGLSCILKGAQKLLSTANEILEGSNSITYSRADTLESEWAYNSTLKLELVDGWTCLG